MSLADQTCIPCRGGVPPLDSDAIRELLPEIPEWSAVSDHHLARTFTFPDFRTALDFVNRIGLVAEQQAHHPDILLAWGKVAVTIWTHRIDGLTESDFVLASKIDRVAGSATNLPS